MKRWPLRISPRRAAFGGTICLILGVVTTVGVAWIISWRVGLVPMASKMVDVAQDSQLWSVLYERRATFKYIEAHASGLVRRDWWPSPEDVGKTPGFVRAVDLPGIVGPVVELTPEWFGDQGSMQGLELHTGWPAHAMAFAWLLDRSHDEALQGALEFGSRTDPLFLPLRTVFPGFLINTLFYAAIWFGLFFAMGRTRRFIRTRRGRCPRCGYDLRGEFDDGCSECGWNRGLSGSANSQEPTAKGVSP